jgi:photosystem II stability/assembly factor-like uncharacterized protein
MKNQLGGKAARLLFVITLSLCVPMLYLGAQTWEPQASGNYSHWSGVHFVNDQLGWVCGSSGKIFKTTNAGGYWYQPGINLVIDFSDIYFANALTGWVTGLGGIIFKTNDGGHVWIPHSVGMTGWLYTIRFVDLQTGWAAGQHGTILKTTNGGINWVVENSGTVATIKKACFVSPTNGWMVTSDGEVLRTDDGGASWTRQLISPPTALNSVFFLNATTGWITGDNGRIFKSINGGTTWTEQTSGTTQQLNDIAFANADSGWVAGNAGTIRFTTNGGSAWASQISATTQDLNAIQFHGSHHGYAIGVNNTILEYAAVHPLAVQLASFTGTVIHGNSVQLDWKTLSETNNLGFEIQRRSQNETEFASLQGVFIPGHGTTVEPQDYRYVDNPGPHGTFYYRLKQIDLDQTSHYSDPILVSLLTDVAEKGIPATMALSQNYPNPFNPGTRIDYQLPATGHVLLKVYDLLGKEVATLVNEVQEAGYRTVQFDASQLTSGLYFYRLTAGQFTAMKKMVLLK